MADINRETIEALTEKIETFAVSLSPEERAVLFTALAKAEPEVSGYESYGAGLGALFASSVGLRPGTSLPSAQVAGQTSYVQIQKPGLTAGVGAKV